MLKCVPYSRYLVSIKGLKLSKQPRRNGHASVYHSNANDPLHQLLNDTGRGIPYRPVLRALTGSINAAILLQQIVFHWVNKGHKPFYKFVEPPQGEHELYNEGDSWLEEIGFTSDEYKHALNLISTKVTRTTADRILRDTQPRFGPDTDKRRKSGRIFSNRQHLVARWKGSDRAVRFVLNEPLLCNALRAVADSTIGENPLQGVGNPLPQGGKTPITPGVLLAPYNIEDAIKDTDTN